MKVLTWNIARPGARRLPAIADKLASADADIVCLQEVPARQAAALQCALQARDPRLTAWHFSEPPDGGRKQYGCAIAARGAIAERSKIAGLALPQLVATATVSIHGISIDVTAVHAPNAAGNGWAKIETLDAVTARVRRLTGPAIVAGDFNEPYSFDPHGLPVSFRMRPEEQQRARVHGMAMTATDRERWQESVARALGADPTLGMRHVWFARGPADPKVVPHVAGCKQRFFDHILVSSHLAVRAAGFEDGWLVPGLSDHAAAWAELDLRPSA